MNEQPSTENPYASPADPERQDDSVRQASWSEDKVTFTFQQSVEDYVAAQDFLSKRESKATGKVRSAIWLGIIVVVIILVLLVGSSPFSRVLNVVGSWVMVAVFAMFTAVFVVVLLLLAFGRLSSSISKLASSDPEEFLCQVQFTISPTGLKTATPTTEMLRRWSSFDEVAETDKYIFLVRKSLVLNWIPKRTFAGPDEVARVVRLLEAYLKPTTKP